MFRGILPKRITSSDFTMVTPLVEQPATAPNKENQPQTTGGVGKLAKAAHQAPPKTSGVVQSKKRERANTVKEKEKEQQQQPQQPESMELAFDKLLEDLQIPVSLRPRLLGMESNVKAAMLKSSQTMSLLPPPTRPAIPNMDTMPATPRASALRRTRSTESMESPRRVSGSTLLDDLAPPRAPALFSESSGSGSPRKTSGHSRGSSLDASKLLSRSQVNLPLSTSVVDLTAGGKAKERAGAKDKAKDKNLAPRKFFSILSGTSSTQLDIENIKKLRLMLRNESASWTEEFLELGGYPALLTRLNEILEVEWREEQHDDQVLHELLRCFKGLCTSEIGCMALRSSCPAPFFQLVSLLYSDKKPGDVATRQLIVDLILTLFELYPSSALPAIGSGRHSNSGPRREAWETASTTSNLITLPAPYKNLFSFIRALLLTPAPRAAEAPETPVSPHEFIESLHRPRIYKTYLQELSDVCRDYFWVFCHPNNAIWILNETDETKVEKPRAPGGMTGGVEFEAMGYFTTHLKLVNAVCKIAADLNLPKEDDHSAYQLHADLFLSGFERIILISRKASTTYYPTLHLELARYVAHAGRAGYELPWTLSRLVGLPPAALVKNQTVKASPRSTPTSTPTKSRAAPVLPSPRKVEPLRMT
ncbi:Drf-GBD domain-containing protein [Mycena indigotica]|uniref:Drf-GBD domain-containing protein n=1 Tax=Mycena indigotica TaxID=2126181 RepID=A0A8H6WDK3_9AGAR|nr:Drf-GBD domain-containing protein [Mycena indigotica]KAF7312586.1 Drf-GBD domain-containing protein [Mycena indigotica]